MMPRSLRSTLLGLLALAAMQLVALPGAQAAPRDTPPDAAQTVAQPAAPAAVQAEAVQAEAVKAEVAQLEAAQPPAVPAAIEVRVLPHAEVVGSEFTLGEVAEFDGADAQGIQRLAAVSLGRSPLPGRSLRLNEPSLRSRLNALLAAGTVQLKVPPEAEVVRASQLVPGADIGARVLALAADGAASTGGDLEQELAGPIPDAVLPTGEVEWQIEPLGRRLAAGGARSFRVVARMQGEEVYRTMARVDQQIYSNVVVAKHAVRRNDIVKAEDVLVERRPITGLKAESYLTRAAEVIGARVKRPIGQGEWINKDMVVAVADVPEGGPVQLVYQTDAVLFTSPGVALVPAKLGAFIPVRNLESGKIVYGVVQSQETVKVN